MITTNRESFGHKFAKENPHMLQRIFGTNDLTPFWLADMDFPVAQPITQELQRLVNRGVYAYEFNADEVYRAITTWNKERHQLSLKPENFIQVSGVLTGIALLVRELSAPGEGVLIQPPVYHQFAQIIKTANRKIVKNPLKLVNGTYQMDFDDLEQKLQTENVKIILLCNPHNPVGRVWKTEELQQLVEIANRYQVTIISDEIHSDIIYSGHRFNSLMSLDKHLQHISLIGSPAKTFGMQSIANGYIYIPDDDTRKTIKSVVASMYLNHGNALTTFATIAAYRKGQEWVNDLVSYLEKTLAWITSYLKSELPMVKMYPVEGTYQVWLDFRETGLNQKTLADLVIKQAKLGLTPGNWFAKENALFMRMNIASPLPKVQQAFQQLGLVWSQTSDLL